jgi:hypothetical protein
MPRPALLTVALLCGIAACSGPSNPSVRVQNLRATKANVQLKDAAANTTNINDVEGGTTSAYIEVAPGAYTVTAVIQNEATSPTVAFSAARDQKYTVVILTGTTPALRIDGPLPVSPLLAP